MYDRLTVTNARPQSAAIVILRQLRAQQWIKNLLVFVPLVLIHELDDPVLLWQSAVAFAGFCLVASASYIVNDLRDLRHDRAHAVKRLRPLAAGTLPLPLAIVLAPLLAGAGLAIAGSVSVQVAASVGAYLGAALCYSFFAKRLVALDVVTLGLLYAARVVAGGYAVQAPVSFWMIAFSMFMFLSLALLKRYSEVLTYGADDGTPVHGRGYVKADLPLLSQMGIASGLISVLVLALYINSEAVAARYSEPEWIWALCPLAAYWICRVWILASRGRIEDDPVLFASHDPPTWLLGIVAAGIIWAAA